MTKRKTRIWILSTIVFAAAAVDGLAQEVVPERLTLETAIEIAHRNNPVFLQARNDEALADWDVRRAVGQLLPSANATGRVTWQGSGAQQFGNLTAADLGFPDQPSFYISSYDLGLNYSLDWATLRGPARARSDRRVTRARIAASSSELGAAVASAYVDVLRRRALVGTARQQLDNARVNLRLAEGQLAVGAATPIDVGQAEVQVGRAEVGLLQAENDAETASMRLLQQMGVDVGRSIVPTTPFELVEPSWEVEELRTMASDRNPDLRAVREARASADVGVSQARGSYFPTLSISTGWGGFAREASSPDFLVAQARSQSAATISRCVASNELNSRLVDPLPQTDCSRFIFTDEQRRRIIDDNDRFPFDFESLTPSVTFALSIPIFQGLSRQRELEAARLQRQDAVQQVREREIALDTELRVTLARLRTAYQSALLEERNRDLAERQLDLARERYQVGAITFVDLMDAQTVLSQAEGDLVVAVYAYHDAVTELEALVGTPLRN